MGVLAAGVGGRSDHADADRAERVEVDGGLPAPAAARRIVGRAGGQRGEETSRDVDPLGPGQVRGVRLTGRTDHLMGEVDRRDVHGTAREVDADRLPGGRVEAELLHGPAALAHLDMRCARDHRATAHQAGDDVVERGAGQPAAGAQLGAAQRTVLAEQFENALLMAASQPRQRTVVFVHDGQHVSAKGFRQ
jgi:hypothetical protein